MGAGALRTPMAAALLALVLVSTDPSVAAFVVVGGGTKLQRLHCLQHLPHLLQMHTCASFMSITITSMIARPGGALPFSGSVASPGPASGSFLVG